LTFLNVIIMSDKSFFLLKRHANQTCPLPNISSQVLQNRNGVLSNDIIINQILVNRVDDHVEFLKHNSGLMRLKVNLYYL